jgi:Mg-chelatase subunit ChlD
MTEELDDDEFMAWIGRHVIGDDGIVDASPRIYAERPKLEDVLAQAAALVGPMRGATRLVREPLREPHSGELDLEATLDNIIAKPFPDFDDLIVQRREERRHQVVMMVDASLSMAGENIALAVVAVAAMALKLPPEDLAVVVFENEARVVTRLEDPDPVEEVVSDMLDEPGWGVTDIEAALKLGAAEIARGRNPRRSGILITDGRPTKGVADPSHLAMRFPQLHVMLTEDKYMDADLCRLIADRGHGEVFPVHDFKELPRRLLDVANRVLR